MSVSSDAPDPGSSSTATAAGTASTQRPQDSPRAAVPPRRPTGFGALLVRLHFYGCETGRPTC